jgi:hypothetical protein
MADPKVARVAVDGSGFSTENVIDVAMEDLFKKDRNDLELELQRETEEVMAEWWKNRLACFQKMRGGVVKKGDTRKASKLNGVFCIDK